MLEVSDLAVIARCRALKVSNNALTGFHTGMRLEEILGLTWDRVFRRLCEEQRIEDFRFHDLRHCAVTNLAEAGVAPEIIMQAVAHSDVEMFLRYRSVQPTGLDAAVEQLNTYLT